MTDTPSDSEFDAGTPCTDHAGNDGDSRRGLLRAAALAAGGAVVATIALGSEQAAAIAVVNSGTTNTEPTGLTDVRYIGAANGTAFLFQAGTSFVPADSAGTFPSALGGWTSLGAKPNGVYGFSGASTGRGVVGAAPSTDGIGVFGTGPTGVRGDSIAGDGVRGQSTSGDGVCGETTSGRGIIGTGRIGVQGDGSRYSFVASSANTAALLLTAVPFGAGTGRPAPPSRTDLHQLGEIDVDVNGDLWFCIADGTPGTWRKLSGTSTAGSFHALTPGRVYDSRVATPGPVARLAAGASRMVSVAGRRDLASGAVVQTNFVPVGATAITANITVADTLDAGFLTANPGGNTVVSAATINWSGTGQILNNGVTLTLNATRELTVIAGGDSTAATHFIIDVTGYYL